MSTVACRNIIDGDWPSILQIQHEAYYAITPESPGVMRSKSDNSPETCFVAVDEHHTVLAYCLAYPYPAAQVPALNTIAAYSSTCEHHLFLHDLAVAKQATGRGFAKQLIHHLLKLAHYRGFQTISLIAIQQSSRFWARHGFVVDASVQIGSSYPDDALYMTRQIVCPQRLNNHAFT